MLPSTVKRTASTVNAMSSSERALFIALLIDSNAPKGDTIDRPVIVDNGDDPSIAHAAPKATRKATPKARKAATTRIVVAATTPKGDWRTERPSKGQISRNRVKLAEINRLERFLGYAPSTHQSLNGGKAATFTGLGYSRHLKNNLNPNLASLKAEARALSAR